MGFKHLKNSVSRYINNIQGWRTNRKIVVIESDDWGSIRMPSKEIYYKCLRAGYPVDQNPYERYDSLLSQDDLGLLFDLLTKFNDKNGNPPVITANCMVANPDFEKIRNDNFANYYYELITETFKKYPAHNKNFSLWKEGIKNKFFFPQYHAREHLNVSLFMDALRRGDPDVHFGFENNMPGCISHGPAIKGNVYVEATNYNSKEDKNQKLAIYLEGLEYFKRLFGYRSETIIPPNYVWSPDFNRAVFLKGVRAFQGIRKIKEPDLNNNFKLDTVYLGKQNSLNQIYLVRNCLFEPSIFTLGINDPVNQCLSDISAAFKLNKPAIVSSHRVNYVGFIDECSRDRSLRMLFQLITKAQRYWPDLEFFNSNQVAELIIGKKIIECEE